LRNFNQLMTVAGGAMSSIHSARNNGKRDLYGLDKWDRQRKFNENPANVKYEGDRRRLTYVVRNSYRERLQTYWCLP
jgi:hypothetical protein